MSSDGPTHPQIQLLTQPQIQSVKLYPDKYNKRKHELTINGILDYIHEKAYRLSTHGLIQLFKKYKNKRGIIMGSNRDKILVQCRELIIEYFVQVGINFVKRYLMNNGKRIHSGIFIRVSNAMEGWYNNSSKRLFKHFDNQFNQIIDNILNEDSVVISDSEITLLDAFPII
jgi:hypothetical protein